MSAEDLARKRGGCGEVISVDAWCDGDAVPSTAGLCASPQEHAEHAAPNLSAYERDVLARFEAAEPAPESFDAVAALRRVEALLIEKAANDWVTTRRVRRAIDGSGEQ